MSANIEVRINAAIARGQAVILDSPEIRSVTEWRGGVAGCEGPHPSQVWLGLERRSGRSCGTCPAVVNVS